MTMLRGTPQLPPGERSYYDTIAVNTPAELPPTYSEGRLAMTTLSPLALYDREMLDENRAALGLPPLGSEWEREQARAFGLEGEEDS